jgi:hypothetical protein
VKVDIAKRDSDGERSIESASGTAAALFWHNIEALETIELGENWNCPGETPPEAFFRAYLVTIRR